ncbi:MAG: PEP/pyruvate-binding domain-containing protein, partial [Desulfobacterales bacterium]
LVDGSPARLSRILPVLYQQIMAQTQATIEEGLNQEHRLLRRRARTKVLLADTLEEADRLYQRYRAFLVGIICQKALMRSCRRDPKAGIGFLETVRADDPDLPFLLVVTGADDDGRAAAEANGADLMNLAGESLPGFLRHYLAQRLGFGDFVFRVGDGREVGRASTLQELESILPDIPDESVDYHWRRHDFTRWLFARTEFLLAERLARSRSESVGSDINAFKTFLIDVIHARRTWRQKGVVADFKADTFEPETEFVKVGKDSMGGKARGLAFLAVQLQQNPDFQAAYEGVTIYIPNTLVLATDVFDQFVDTNDLRVHSRTTMSDDDIARRFMKGRLSDTVTDTLRSYLTKVDWPIAVRSSSLMEDSQSHPFAGIYRTYMLPNADPDLEERLSQLVDAVKLVYASTFFQEPRAFAKRTDRRPDEEKMGVVIQRLVGARYGDLFYPAVSGVAQSYNYYPIAPMTPEDGIANVAMGLGVTVVGGERSLRFCPRYPQNLPQFSTVEDILSNAQRQFYGMKMGQSRRVLNTYSESTLDKRDISDLEDRRVLELLASTYLPEEHRIKDALLPGGYPVLTLARILKHKMVPLADILKDLLALGEKWMGCAVDIEFSLNFPLERDGQPELALLQIRPMGARKELIEVDIDDREIDKAVCYSTHALGNGETTGITDIVFVKPEDFDASRTVDMVKDIRQINARLNAEGRPYILVGPGRWGSQDPWLGIPVQWADISGTSVIVETTLEDFRPDPSQGSHFFHNLTSLNMAYFSILDDGHDRIRWEWLKSLPIQKVTRFLSHARVETPLTVKVDGKTSRGVISAAS